ncbi:MAG: gliding motility-associated C-terminal domain-containing protein, partial [Bacteroidales bacterium]|nr:gliding motility-associated C-terminal domain-containing protein [Bacteroidales bacterium]
ALHSASQNPEFIIRIKRQNGASFSNISDTLYYVVQSPVSGGSLGVWTQVGSAVYKPWAKAAINLYNYLYETVRIEVLVGDCSASGHYGYCYIAGDCQPMSLQASGCSPGASNEVATITAPSGLSGYQWYRSRYGELGSNQINDPANYEPIPGTRGQDSILDVYVEDFPTNPSTGNPYQCNTFKCVLTSYLDPAKPIRSVLYVNACNQKPTVAISTQTQCDGSILVIDRSTTPTSEGPVGDDTVRSQWIFRDGSGQNVGSANGGQASHTYPTAGNDSVKIRTVSPLDSTCYTERTLPIHIRKNPNIGIQPSRTSICANDTITLRGTCSDPIGIIRHRWVIRDPIAGDTTLTGNPVVHRFRNTSTVEYTALNADSCESTVSTTISIGYFPALEITGDTVVCIGNSNTLHVSCDLPGCSYEWYADTMQTTPLQTGADYTFTPTRNGIMFAKVISPYGCSTWSMFRYRIMSSTLEADTTRICVGDEVTLTGEGAEYYTWESNPVDASLDGQDSVSQVVVTPRVTTTYTMTGHGGNGCNTTPLSVEVRVDPFPEFAISYTPDYIDIFNPVLYLSDHSSSRVRSIWEFPTDDSEFPTTAREFEYHFINVLGYDSIPIKLTTATINGCAQDTTIYVPVDVFTEWIPNVFTPTRDVNRTFGMRYNIRAVDFTMTIFNRWGLKVFETNDQNEHWDGTYKGKECPEGSYVWIITYRQFEGTDMVKKRGTMMLLK